MSSDGCVQVSVGGWQYCIALSDIEKFPDSFLQCMVKKEWMKNGPIVIQRDGKLFRFVYSFLVNGHLPRNKFGEIELCAEILEAIIEEADFFGLSDLLAECNTVLRASKVINTDSFLYLTEYAKIVRRRSYKYYAATDYKSEREDKCALLNELKDILTPFCINGKILSRLYAILLLQDIHKLDVDGLISVGTVSVEGSGALEIRGLLCRRFEENFIIEPIKFEQLAPHLHLSLRARKVLIHPQGSFQEQGIVLPETRREGHIGTLVVILNSEYTGGELEVTHGGRTEVVTGPYHWVAIYGDCLHKINPVTSGTRVSLIYDIYSRPTEHESHEVEELIMVDPNLVDRHREIKEEKKDFLCRAVAQELTQFDTVMITLQQLYPECQTTNPDILKGGVRALYDLLASATIHAHAQSNLNLSMSDPDDLLFDVQIITVTIYYSYDSNNAENNRMCVSPYSTEIVKTALEKMNTSFPFGRDEKVVDYYGKHKMFIPTRMNVMNRIIDGSEALVCASSNSTRWNNIDPRISIVSKMLKPKVDYTMILPVLFLEYLAVSLVRSLIPGMIVDSFGKYSYLAVGVMETLKGLLAFVSSPLFGKLSDKIGRKYCLLVTVLGTTLPVLFLAFTTNMYIYGMMLAISGLFSATFTLTFAYISDCVDNKNRAPAYGIALATFGLSFTVGPIAGSYMAVEFGEQSVFLLSLLLVLINVVYIVVKLPETAKLVNSEEQAYAKFGVAMEYIPNSWKFAETFKIFSADPFMWNLATIVFIYYTAVWAIVSTLMVYITRHLEFSPLQLGWLLSAYGLATMFSEGILVRIIVPRIGELNSMRLGLLAFSIQCLLVATSTNPGWIFLSVLFSMGANLFYPAVSSLVSKVVSEDSQGEALGALNGIKALTEGFGPLFFGGLMSLFEHSSQPGAPFILATMLSLWAFLHCFELPPEGDMYTLKLDAHRKGREEGMGLLYNETDGEELYE